MNFYVPPVAINFQSFRDFKYIYKYIYVQKVRGMMDGFFSFAKLEK